MTPLTTRRQQVRTRLYDPAVVAQLAVTVLAIGVLLLASSLLSLPHKVAVTVVNETDYDLDVTVRAPDTEATTLFGRVEHDASRTQPHLIDPGDEWVISFRHRGTDLGELRLTDNELDDLDHTIEVPTEVTTKAHDAGLHPSPD